jgi:catechol 2,3-dioxygenase-like lactoylglutathione lyase family enzyme
MVLFTQIDYPLHQAIVKGEGGAHSSPRLKARVSCAYPKEIGTDLSVEVPKPVIDLSIYVMPSFATLTVSSLERAQRWYVDGLGFVVLATIPGPAGEPALVHLRRWRYQDLLLVPARHPQPAHGAGPHMRLTFSAHGTDLAALAATARAVGGGSIEGPRATSWNTLDLLARDPDGYEVVFTSRLPSDQQDPAFAARMEEVRREMLAGSHAPRQEYLPDDRSSTQQ